MPTTINGTTGVSLVANNATINTPAISGGTLTSSTLVTPTMSGTVTGLSSASMPAGSVVQVVQSSYSTFTSSSSSSYADTGLSASITPSSASNKVLVFASMVGVGKNTGNCRVALRLVRNSTTIEDFSTETAMSPWNTTTQVDVGTTSCIILDSPATTSSTTYKVQIASNGNVTQTFVNNVNGSTEVGCTMTLMEIKV